MALKMSCPSGDGFFSLFQKLHQGKAELGSVRVCWLGVSSTALTACPLDSSTTPGKGWSDSFLKIVVKYT